MKVGIDLGTTYSSVSKYNEETSKAEVIPNAFGKDITPSVICFLDDGEILIGEDAKDMQAGGAGLIAAAFKRGMGDPSYSFEAFGKEYSAQDLSTMLLKHLIEDAESKLGEKIEAAVITVPAYFNDFQRSATMDAGEACGITVLKIINEPTSAAVSYGYDHEDDKTLLVYDLGGGTFDVTIVKIDGNTIEVVGTEGDHVLGGKDWDSVIVKYIADEFEEEFGSDPRQDDVAKNELMVAAENYKKVISKAESVAIQVKFEGNTGKYTLTREEFNLRTRHLLSATEDVCNHLMDDLGLTWSDIDDVLLVGGSTRMPQIAEFIKEVSHKNIIVHTDTDLAVAKGAAINAAMASSDKTGMSSGATGLREVRITDVTAHSLGVLAVSPDGRKYVNKIMIPRNSSVPKTVKDKFKIQPGNVTDNLEFYILQGESRNPSDCIIVRRDVVSEFYNPGTGVVLEIEYIYDENGRSHLRAYQGGDPVTVSEEEVPEDLGWMTESPGAADTTSTKDKNIVICVDLSRSMTGEPIEKAKEAVLEFIDTVKGEGIMFGLVVFGDKVKISQEITDDIDALKEAVENMRVKEVGRGTDASPFETARLMLEDRRGANVILVLTDGIWGKKDRAIGQFARCKSERINSIAIGFGEADTVFLREIATLDSGALYTSLDKLGDTFSTIATEISTGSMGLSVRD